jgi:CRISPR/Cas system-associated exonuclease Cas4 (RecB family)
MEFKEFLNKAIEDYLRREIETYSIGVYYPSLLWSCIRRQWLMYKKPSELPIGTLKVFESGTMAHKFFTNVLFKSFISSELIDQFEYEKDLIYEGDGFKILGKFDDLLHFKFENKPVLVEVKTVRDLRFFREVKDHHIMQLQFYMNMIKVPNLEAYLVYLDRGNLEMKIFSVKKDEEAFKKIINRAEKLHYYLTKNEVPIAEAKIDKTKEWMCRYCHYKRLCKEIGDKKVLEGGEEKRVMDSQD